LPVLLLSFYFIHRYSFNQGEEEEEKTGEEKKDSRPPGYPPARAFSLN
jgi:hypothetical protein